MCIRDSAGPLGNLVKRDYTLKTRWVYEYNRDVKWVTLLPGRALTRGLNSDWEQWYGYNPVHLYALGITSESEAKRFAAEIWTGKAAARRGRLVWCRIEKAIQHVRVRGTTGLWEVSDYRAQRGSLPRRGLVVHATSEEHALAQFAVVAPMLGYAPSNTLHAGFKQLGTPEDAARLNVRRVNRKVDQLKTKIDSLRHQLEMAEEELVEATARVGAKMSAVMLLGVAEAEAAE